MMEIKLLHLLVPCSFVLEREKVHREAAGTRNIICASPERFSLRENTRSAHDELLRKIGDKLWTYTGVTVG